jgi:hypothetical protein
VNVASSAAKSLPPAQAPSSTTKSPQAAARASGASLGATAPHTRDVARAR